MVIETFPGTNIQIVQSENSFKFGIDAILLASFGLEELNEKRCLKICDFCTGSGVVPVLMAQHFLNSEFSAMEIVKNSYDCAIHSVKLNNLESRIKIYNEDVQKASEVFGNDYFDVITVNPPYFSKTEEFMEETEKNIARHELYLTLEACVHSAAKVLKTKGDFLMIHKADRINDIVLACEKNRLYIRKIVFVYPSADKNAELVLIHGKKNVHHAVEIEMPLIIRENGIFTEKIEEKRRNLLKNVDDSH